MQARGVQRVAIIGGGCGGVVAARCLADAGIKSIDIFESGHTFGGIWAPQPLNPAVYANLRTNLPTVVMQSPELDFPPGLRSYIEASTLGEYIESYAEAFGVAALPCKFRTTVTRVEPVQPEGGSEGMHSAGTEAVDAGRWRVHWRHQESGREEEALYDAVAVATGHYNVPYVPELPGQREWVAGGSQRSVMHSQQYNTAEPFEGQAVLVVGGRSSAVDIARELRGVATQVYVLDKKCKEVHHEERCTHVPLGAALTAGGQLECGGRVVEGPGVDTVILATGYQYDFPFLSPEALGMQWERFVSPLYMHILHAEHPTLAFIGIPQSVPCPIPLFEAQARLLAAHWLEPALTSQEQRQAWVQQRTAAVLPRMQDLHLMRVEGTAWAYMRELMQLAGSSGAAYEQWETRMRTVQEIYQDRVSKQAELPWRDDWYRNCEYSVDWEAGTWDVITPSEVPSSL